MKAACSPASSSCSRLPDDIQNMNARDNNPRTLAVVHDANHFRRFPCGSHERLGIRHDRGLRKPACEDNRIRCFSCFGTKLVLVKNEDPWAQCDMTQGMVVSEQA